MTTRTFATWVEPVASELRETRHEIVRVARQLLPEQWSHASPLEGWTYKDLLAHLATGDWVFQTVLGSVTANQPLDLSITSFVNPTYVAEQNARQIAERSERAVEELIVEAEAEGEESQELLARLTPGDEARTQADPPLSLGDYLRNFASHDRTHTDQLRTALDQVML